MKNYEILYKRWYEWWATNWPLKSFRLSSSCSFNFKTTCIWNRIIVFKTSLFLSGPTKTESVIEKQLQHMVRNFVWGSTRIYLWVFIVLMQFTFICIYFLHSKQCGWQHIILHRSKYQRSNRQSWKNIWNVTGIV